MKIKLLICFKIGTLFSMQNFSLRDIQLLQNEFFTELSSRERFGILQIALNDDLPKMKRRLDLFEIKRVFPKKIKNIYAGLFEREIGRKFIEISSRNRLKRLVIENSVRQVVVSMCVDVANNFTRE